MIAWKMADVSNDDSEFSGFNLSDIGSVFDPAIWSDILVSPVSSPDISPATLDSESDEEVIGGRDLRKPYNFPFTERVGASF
jgi:hypothetical protein